MPVHTTTHDWREISGGREHRIVHPETSSTGVTGSVVSRGMMVRNGPETLERSTRSGFEARVIGAMSKEANLPHDAPFSTPSGSRHSAALTLELDRRHVPVVRDDLVLPR